MPKDGRKWDRRLERARQLAGEFPFARQILHFYSHLTASQKDLYLCMPASYASGGAERRSLPAGLDDVDLGILLARWGTFLTVIEGAAPKPLAACAHELARSGLATGAALLRSAWPGAARTDERGADSPGAGNIPVQAPELDPGERFCAQAFLQPFGEFLADHAEVSPPPVRRAVCPYCGSEPLLGVLRPEGEGGKRSLICSFCRTEWDYLRIACPSCDERREQKLCVYTTPKFAPVRIEGCETCKTYIKTVDLTHTGLAVPEVDDLASVPLTLWAEENGYHKLAPGILFL